MDSASFFARNQSRGSPPSFHDENSFVGRLK